MLKAPIHDILMEHFENDLSKIVIVLDGVVYFKATDVMDALNHTDSVQFQRVCQWLEKDILPSVQVMPYGTPLKL